MDKTLAFVLESSGLAGGVKVVLDYAVKLRERGWKTKIWSLQAPPRWYDLGEVPWQIFRDYADMRKWMLRDGKNTPRVATWWVTAHAINGMPGQGLYLVQDIETSYYYRPKDMAQVLKTYELPLAKFTCNEWVSQQLPGVPCVGQAFDAEYYKPVKYAYPGVKNALSIARRQYLKGFGELGEFSRRLAEVDKTANLFTFSIEPMVQFTGAHRQHFTSPDAETVLRLYRQSGAYVCTSLHEGFGLPLLEAMGCGTPVATFDCDGNIFCVDDQNCLKVPKGDVPALVDAACRVMTDRKLRERLVEGGFETARQLSDWNGVLDKLEAFLTQTVQV